MIKFKSKMKTFAIRARLALINKRGEGYIGEAVKILSACVLGALLLAGLYMLFDNTVLPTLVEKIKSLFNYAG